MKAVALRAYGGPEALNYEDFPDPIAGPGEVLVRVIASSVNPLDVKLRSGAMKDFVPLKFPAILGLDVSGVVEDIGQGVTAFAHGDKVFAHASQTYAALCNVKAVDLAKIPEGMDVADVAALPTVTTTGAQLADLALRSNPSGSVLITGAIGNVGRSAVYEAKRRGWVVIAGVLKRQVEEASKLGADHVIAIDDGESVRTLEPVGAVADTIAGPTADKLMQKVKEGGVFASVLASPSTASSFPAVHVEVMQVKPAPETQLRMAEAVRTGRLRIPLGQKYFLKDAAKAHAAVESHSPGKTLLLV